MRRFLLACSALVGVAFQPPLRRLPHAPGPVAAPSGERRRTAVVAPAKKRKRKSGAATGAPKAAPPPAPKAPAPAPKAPAPEAVAAKAKPAALRIKLPPLPEEIDASSTASMASPQVFPVASESPEVSSVEEALDRDGSIMLPDMDELERRKATRTETRAVSDVAAKIERGDGEALRRAMESDPNADVNFKLFAADRPGTGVGKKKDVDLITIALGENADKFFGIESAYLQIGHSALVLVILLATFVYDPSFPLTNLPVEFRDFFKQGLLAVYAVNAVVAGAAFFEAQKRDQPVAFWVVKCLFIGGVAFNQLTTSTRVRRP